MISRPIYSINYSKILYWLLWIPIILNLVGCQPKEVTSAKMYIQNYNWDKAIEQLEKAIEAYPNNAEAHFLLGQAYGKKSRYKDMNNEFNLSLEISNKFEQEITAERKRHWIEKYDAGIKAVDNEDFQRAEALFKTAIIINPMKYESHKKLAFIYQKTNVLGKALAIYKNLLEKSPDDLDLLLSIGNLYYRQQKFEQVVDILKKALEIKPNHNDALAKLALSYDVLGNTKEATEAFQRAVEANPLDKDLIFLFGVHHYKLKNYKQAIQLFEQVLELNPDDFEATLNIGNIYLSIAENERQKLSKINFNNNYSPEEILQIKNSAILNYKKAIPYLERALEMQPNHPNLWRNLGVAYINSGEKEKGEQALLKSEELKTNLSK
ncbi:MAG: tetratricopeptide repeat protein [bacterium]